MFCGILRWESGVAIHIRGKRKAFRAKGQGWAWMMEWTGGDKELQKRLGKGLSAGGRGQRGVKGDSGPHLEAWNSGASFLGISRFTRKGAMASGTKVEGGAVWDIWFLTVGFEELRRDARQDVGPSRGDGAEMGLLRLAGQGGLSLAWVRSPQKLCHWSSREDTLPVVKVRAVAVGKMC